MKSVQKMIDDRLTIKDGFYKGARITITDAIVAELMEKYAKNYHKRQTRKNPYKT